MALTPFQRDVCRLLAGNRLRSGESYVAGGAALNTLLAAPRLSREVNLFHDTDKRWQAIPDGLAAAAEGEKPEFQREATCAFARRLRWAWTSP